MEAKEVVLEAFVQDLYQTVKASRKFKDERVFRHTLYQDPEIMIFCALFPKDDVLVFPDLTDEFKARLQKNNFLGVITDTQDKIDIIWLGGTAQSFQKIASRRQLRACLSDSALQEYIESALQERAVKADLDALDDPALGQELVRVLLSA